LNVYREQIEKQEKRPSCNNIPDKKVLDKHIITGNGRAWNATAITQLKKSETKVKIE